MDLGYIYYLAQSKWNYRSMEEVDQADNCYIWMLHKYHREENYVKPEEDKPKHRQVYEDSQYQENQNRLRGLG